MLAIALVLLLALALGGAGFALHALWIVAGIVLVIWLLGFLVRGASGARWYRWRPGGVSAGGFGPNDRYSNHDNAARPAPGAG